MSKKKILITGGTGLIGSRLQQLLANEGFCLHILTRSKKEDSENIKYFHWDPANREINEEAVLADHIINLAGAGIADRRWTEARKKTIINSRTGSLELLGKALRATGHRPDTLISASAIGFYGDREDELLTEESASGQGFLAESCQQWEDKANELAPLADRMAIVRIGIVLSTCGGALEKILMTEKLHLLNYFGNGRQYYSWIHIDDLCRIFLAIIQNKNYQGIYNGVAPDPLRNKEFTRQIAAGLEGNYLVLPAPALGLKLAMGEMSSVVLSSNRVIPERLVKAGFEYRHDRLPDAIRHLKANKI